MDGVAESGVTGAAPAPAETSTPVSTAADTGSTGAPASAGQPSVSTEQPAPAVAANDESGVDADAGEIPGGLTEADIQQIPDQWRDRFNSLLSGYKSLEQDHRPWKGLGQFDQVQTDLNLVNGLYGIARDEQGNPVYDQETGLPLADTREFVSSLAESSPAVLDQLVVDLLESTRSDGRMYVQHFFEQIGLNAAHLQEYANLTEQLSRNPNATVTNNGEVVSADDLQYIPENYHEVFKGLNARDRAIALGLVNEEEQAAYLEDKARLQRFDQFEQKYQQDQEAKAKQEHTEFLHSLKQRQTDNITKLREDGLRSIQAELSQKVQFSAEPGIQAAQQAGVMAVIATILNPDLRFTTAPLFEALGISLDQTFESALEAVGNHSNEYIKFDAIKGNPRYAEHRNDALMGKAQAAMNDNYRTVMAKLNSVALTVAKALTGGNQILREATAEQLNGARGRPTIGGAKPAANGVQKNPYNPATQHRQWFAWQSQNRQQNS